MTMQRSHHNMLVSSSTTMGKIIDKTWTVGKFLSQQSVSMVHGVHSWIQNRYCESDLMSFDEEINKILNMYSPEELGEKADRYLMNLRTDILDIASEYDNDIRVQMYIFRNSHSFGAGKNCIVINITDSNIDMKVKLSKVAHKQKDSGNKIHPVVNWASATKNVLKRVSSLNFL